MNGAAPQMSPVPPVSERVVFEQTIEGLLRALGPHLNDATRARLKAVGLDVDGKLKVAYPVTIWIEVLWIAGEVLAPGKDRDEATYIVGRRFLEAYEATLMGKAACAMARVVGPKRTLDRMTRNFRTGSSYGTSRLVELGGGRYEAHCFPVSVPGFYRGLIEAGLEVAGAKNARVTLVRWERPEEAVYEVTWG